MTARKPNTCDAEQVRGECNFFGVSIALLLCSDSPSLPLHGESCSSEPGRIAGSGRSPSCLVWVLVVNVQTQHQSNRVIAGNWQWPHS